MIVFLYYFFHVLVNVELPKRNIFNGFEIIKLIDDKNTNTNVADYLALNRDLENKKREYEVLIKESEMRLKQLDDFDKTIEAEESKNYILKITIERQDMILKGLQSLQKNKDYNQAIGKYYSSLILFYILNIFNEDYEEFEKSPEFNESEEGEEIEQPEEIEKPEEIEHTEEVEEPSD